MRLLGQPIDEGDRLLLVRDRDVGAQEFVAPNLRDGIRELLWGAIPQLVLRVDAQTVEGGLVHRA